MADLSDLLKFFDVLDSVDQVPPVHCEASDLYYAYLLSHLIQLLSKFKGFLSL